MPCGPLEVCEGHWEQVVWALAGGPSDVPSDSESVAVFNAHILPMKQAARTRRQYKTHRLGLHLGRVEGNPATVTAHA